METVQFSPEKEIPVVAEADVLVVGGGPVGGGPGGVGAAVMSAREGASTVLAEQHGRMGGTATFGEITPMMINHYAADGKLEHGVSMDQPVYTELMERLWSYLPEELRPICGRACRILDELDRILLGHHEVHRLLRVAFPVGIHAAEAVFDIFRPNAFYI